MIDIRKKSDTELDKMLAERREHLRQTRFDMTGTKITDVKDSANTRKEIARIMTELRARKEK
jgi:ribosomal protein L29